MAKGKVQSVSTARSKVAVSCWTNCFFFVYMDIFHIYKLVALKNVREPEEKGGWFFEGAYFCG